MVPPRACATERPLTHRELYADTRRVASPGQVVDPQVATAREDSASLERMNQGDEKIELFVRDVVVCAEGQSGDGREQTESATPVEAADEALEGASLAEVTLAYDSQPRGHRVHEVPVEPSGAVETHLGLLPGLPMRPRGESQ